MVSTIPNFIPYTDKKDRRSGTTFASAPALLKTQGFLILKRIRRMGIKYFSWLIRKASYRNQDNRSYPGYRACCSLKVIRLFANDYPKDYPELETVVTVLRNKLKAMRNARFTNECQRSAKTGNILYH